MINQFVHIIDWLLISMLALGIFMMGLPREKRVKRKRLIARIAELKAENALLKHQSPSR